MNEKIKPHHFERKAVLYVRQSSTHQVIHNRESRSLQYAMRERLAVLGWPEVEIIDDDWASQPRAARRGLDLSAWSPKFASARTAPWQHVRSRALRATAAIGSNSSRCAAWSTPYWWTRKPATHLVKATTGGCSG
jgi:hypothetical protein